MRLAVVVVLGVAACGDDPTLRVDVQHPIAVARTVISVYEPADFGCEEVELGDTTEAALATALVTQTTVVGTEPSDPLTGMSRTATKVIVARGFDASGTLATGGCQTVELIEGDDRVEIKTARAALASISPLGLSGAEPFSLTVALTDPDGIALPENRLSWRVYGPYGSTPASAANPVLPDGSGVWHLAQPTCVNQQGTATIRPVPPATVGGFAIEVRPSWPIERPPLISGFNKLEPAVFPTVPVAGVRHPCAIRAIAGTSAPESSIVCVEATTPGNLPLVGREYRVSTAGGTVTIASLREHAVPQQTIALISIPRAGGLRDVYAVTAGGFVVGVASPLVAPQALALQTGLRSGTADDALLLPDCGLAAPARIAMRIDTATERKIVVKSATGAMSDEDFHGVSAALTQTITMRAAGCVTEIDPRDIPFVRHALVVDVPSRTPPARQISSAYFDCVLPEPDKDRCFVDLPVTRAGAGFLPGDTPRLAGANIDASGIVVSTWGVLLQPQDRSYLRLEYDRTPAASIPLHISYGQLDGDTEFDAFWDVTNLDQSETAFQVTYAQLAGTVALSALSASQPLTVLDLLIGDVTSDGKDDIVMVGIANPTTTAVHGLLVQPSQIAASVPALPGVDVSCPSP